MSFQKNNNKLPTNLPQLQNLIKRDPDLYLEEFQHQHRLFEAQKTIFEHEPTAVNLSLNELVMFLAQISHCYPAHLSLFPEDVVGLLRKHGPILNPSMRLGFVKALVLLRNKNLLSPTALLQLFFRLLRSQDKNLRKFLQQHIVADIKQMNAKSKNMKLNRELQNFMLEMLKDNHAVAIKTSLDILIDLYRKQVWNDSKTANIISTALFSKVRKVMIAAIAFFVGKEENDDGGGDSDSSDSESEMPNLKKVLMANRVNTKNNKRKKQADKAKNAFIKKQNKPHKDHFDFSAIRLLNDPQQVCERMFKKLERMTELFEVKLMTMNMISRMIGLHELYLPNFYTYLQRYLFVHQRDVTKIMAYLAQSAHPQVPPNDLEPLVRTLADNFVTERYSGEVMGMGLNAIRELCARNPFCMNEDLLEDLCLYKSHKEKSVAMAAKQLITLFREKNPQILGKKHRGAPTEMDKEQSGLQYGDLNSKSFIPGAEVLTFKSAQEIKLAEEESSEDDGWVDVSSDEEEEQTKKSSSNKKKNTKEIQKPAEEEDLSKKDAVREVMRMTVNEREQAAQDIVTSRCLDDADFARIDVMQAAKHVERFSKSKSKRKRGKEDDISNNGEVVTVKNIEMIYKKRKHDKVTRMSSVMEGRMDREKFGSRKGRMNSHASTTNREKTRTKAFSMMKHKIRGKGKMSFKDRQQKLKTSLLRKLKNS